MKRTLLITAFVVSMFTGAGASAASDKIVFEVTANYEMNDADSKLTAQEALAAATEEKVAKESIKIIAKSDELQNINSIIHNKDLAYIIATIAKITPFSTNYSLSITGTQVANQKSKVTVDTGAIKRYAEVLKQKDINKVSDLEQSRQLIHKQISQLNEKMKSGVKEDDLLYLSEERNRLFKNLKLTKTALRKAIDDVYLSQKSEDEYKRYEKFYQDTKINFIDEFAKSENVVQYNRTINKEDGTPFYTLEIDVQWRVDIPYYTESISKIFQTSENRVVNQDDIALMVWPNNDGDFIKDKMYQHLLTQTVYLNLEMGPYKKKIQIAGPKEKWNAKEFIDFEQAKEKGFNVIYFAYTKGIEHGKAKRHVVIEGIREKYINHKVKSYLSVGD